MRWHLLILLLALPTAVSCSVSESGNEPLYADFGKELQQVHREILFGAKEWEIVAVNPDWPTEESRADPSTVHGYTVRGRAKITDRATRLELLTALAAGARENDGMVAACFNPRHVIRAEMEGSWCELIICFECFSCQVWDGAERVDFFDLSETPKATFDRIYGEAGLSIAKRGE